MNINKKQFKYNNADLFFCQNYAEYSYSFNQEYLVEVAHEAAKVAFFQAFDINQRNIKSAFYEHFIDVLGKKITVDKMRIERIGSMPAIYCPMSNSLVFIKSGGSKCGKNINASANGILPSQLGKKVQARIDNPHRSLPTITPPKIYFLLFRYDKDEKRFYCELSVPELVSNNKVIVWRDRLITPYSDFQYLFPGNAANDAEIFNYQEKR